MEVNVFEALVVAATDVVSATVLVDDGPVAAATLYQLYQCDANQVDFDRTHLVLADVVDATEVVEAARVEPLAVVVAAVVDASVLGKQRSNVKLNAHA